MYAEWMKNFDLSITPEEIKEYEQRRKKRKQKIEDDTDCIHKLVKTHKKSWFVRFNLDEYDANNYLSEHPLWKCKEDTHKIIPYTHYEDIVVLQIMVYARNKAIAEIVFKKDYKEE